MPTGMSLPSFASAGTRRALAGMAVAVAVATGLSDAVLAVGRDKAMYVRGTLSATKERARPLLKILEARSGKAITFQGAATCRQYKTPKECEVK
jgi:hypothetical protein